MFGGIASNCYDLAYSLSKKEVPTTVFSGRSNKITVEKLNDYLEVIRLPFLNLPPRFMWFQLQNFRIFSKLLKDHTVLHAVNPQSGAICVYLKKKLKKPLVTSIHGVQLRDLKVFVSSPFSDWTMGDFGYNVLEYPLNEFFVRICLTNSDHIIACGSTTLNDLAMVYHGLNFERVSVIHNGINFDKINGIRNDSMSTSCLDDLSVMYYGRLYWRKGVLHLIKALAVLKQDFLSLRLKIFGKGPLERKIRKLVSKLGLKDEVHFRGHVPYIDLVREIKRADLVTLPSLCEVGPFVAALEAMACKKPLVAFDLPFTREFIVNMYNGLLAKAEDIKDLSEKIRLLLSNKRLRINLGQNAYKCVKEKYDWNVLVKKYINVYENLTH